MDKFSRINNVTGWLCGAVALTVYMVTLQPSVSFWDCGEFIATAFNIQVGHQPGAPLFMMIGKLFTLAAGDPSDVAFWMNTLSALASALTVVFLFWTITALARKLLNAGGALSARQTVLVSGAGLTGALAYAFSDSFWFSAVEAEVYAVSSLCTAVVFWAALRWEADPRADGRWLVLIAYLIGLSIGIHLLSLLAIPAIVLVCYFRTADRVTVRGLLLAILAGCGMLALVQHGIGHYLVLFAFRTDLYFVNSLHLPFGTGVLFFLLLVAGCLGTLIWYSHRKRRAVLNLAAICTVCAIFGYSSYAMIMIRAEAKTSINISNPDNGYGLLRYLAREQYAQAPLLSGPFFDSRAIAAEPGKTLYRKGADRYEIAGRSFDYTYDRKTVFPRIYSDDQRDVDFYRSWLGLGDREKPSFIDNIRFFGSYQAGFMYMRYLLWNFVGRQSAEQGHGDTKNGNWISGIRPLDQLRLDGDAPLSPMAADHEGHNRFYGLPFLLGICGLIWHFRRNGRQAAVVTTLFLSTGLAIVLYLNQDPLQVRERDYAYVGSFYTFAIWIGLGVLALWHGLQRFLPARPLAVITVAGSLAAVPLLMVSEGWDDHDRSENLVARDMAVNYLESCAPNAILFTNADNDTYPLWYAQQVEGIRRDVRIVNLQLLFDPAYITALKKPAWESRPLPIRMTEEKYRTGVRDVLYYMDYGLSDSVELKDIYEVLVSDHEGDQVEMQDGSRQNILPTRKIRLTVDPKQLLATGTVTPEELSRVVQTMEWTYGKNHVTRSDLAVLDILAHNNWERPVYFTAGISQDSYFGLDKYLHLEGYAYRLLPLKPREDARDKSQVTHSAAFYSNVMNKFRLESFRRPAYLDPESRRVSDQTWQLLNTLGENLVAEGKTEEARKLMGRILDNMPDRNYTIRDSVERYRAASTLYKLRETGRANDLMLKTVSFLEAELVFLAGLDKEDQESRVDDIRTCAALLNLIGEEAVRNKQDRISARVEAVFTSAEKALGA